MKLLLASDIHLSERPPSSCTESYADDLFDLLEQAAVVGRERGVRAFIWAGDTFHHKAANRVTHRLVQRVSEYLRTSCEPWFPVLTLAGNHDMANDRYESVLQTQPLGHLWRSGTTELNGWAYLADGELLPVFGVPWLQGYGDADTHADMEDVLDMTFDPYRKQVFEDGTGQHTPLVVTHAPLYPPGKELTWEYFPAERWARAMGAYSGGGQHRVFYGHVHEPHGTWGEYGVTDDRDTATDFSITFCNNGALSRGSLHEYNLTRQVGVTLYDTLTGEFEFVPLRARPASEVFRLEEKGHVTDIQGRLDSFLEGVGAATLEVMSVESVVEHIRSLRLGSDVERLAEELLTEAQHGSNKRG